MQDQFTKAAVNILGNPETYLRAFQLVVVGPECVEALRKECAGMDVKYYWMSAAAPSVKAVQVMYDASQIMSFALSCPSAGLGKQD